MDVRGRCQREANNTQCYFGSGERDDSWWIDSQKVSSDIKYNYGLVKGVLEETAMIHFGWTNQKKASNTQESNGPVEDML